MRNLIFVTSNVHKLAEAEEILGNYNIKSVNLDIPEIQGDVKSVTEHKALSAFEKIQDACFVEDTSLSFEAWGGLPGPYIKNFLEGMGVDGLCKALSGFSNKKATAVCSIGYMDKTLEKPLIFQGKVHGHITRSKGACGFEWDKIFIPEGYDKTFAELGMEVKNNISHRKKVMTMFLNYLEKASS